MVFRPAGSAVVYAIGRLPEGGYVVEEPVQPGMVSSPLFASSDVGPALDFIRGRLEPPTDEVAVKLAERKAAWEGLRCKAAGAAGKAY